MPWEREIYVSMLIDYVKEENDRLKQINKETKMADATLREVIERMKQRGQLTRKYWHEFYKDCKRTHHPYER